MNASTRPKLQILKQPHQYVHRTQQSSPIDNSRAMIKLSHPKQFTMPAVNKTGYRQNFGVTSKPLRSLNNSKQKGTDNRHKKIPIFDINILKNSVGNLDKEALLDYATGRKKKVAPQSNRILTEKKVAITEGNDRQVNSERQKKLSASKVTFRLGGKPKSLQKAQTNNKSPNSKDVLIKHPQKIRLVDESPKNQRSKSNQKKLTPLQKQQTASYQIFYVGPRRIYTRSDFTDAEGDPKVMIHDSIAYRYEIVSMLGRGSFGKVFKAYDHKKKQFIALKLIKSQKKFLDQAKIQVQILQCTLLKDPKLKSNIVRMKGSFVFRGHSCITFQILHKNLYQFLKQHHFTGFSHDLIRRFSIQILQALLFFKKNRVIHCDLKPENILLKEENKSGIKVIDVGSGCFQDKQLYTYIQSRFYRAPEIILGIKYTPAIDMWSFGCIMSQLFNGFPLFPGQSENQQMIIFMQLIGEPPHSLLKRAERRKKFFNDDLTCKIPQQKGKQKYPKSIKLEQAIGSNDAQFIDLISRCLEWDPEQRIKPEQALMHQWILKGLPQQIRSQHIEQMKQQAQLQQQ